MYCALKIMNTSVMTLLTYISYFLFGISFDIDNILSLDLYLILGFHMLCLEL